MFFFKKGSDHTLFEYVRKNLVNAKFTRQMIRVPFLLSKIGIDKGQSICIGFGGTFGMTFLPFSFMTEIRKRG